MPLVLSYRKRFVSKPIVTFNHAARGGPRFVVCPDAGVCGRPANSECRWSVTGWEGGVAAGIFAGSPEAAMKWLAQGATYMTHGNDTDLPGSAYRRILTELGVHR